MALQGGITLAPGHVFSATYQFPNFIRLNAATFNYTTERAIERLALWLWSLGGGNKNTVTTKESRKIWRPEWVAFSLCKRRYTRYNNYLHRLKLNPGSRKKY
jgi:hypothetical protein